MSDSSRRRMRTAAVAALALGTGGLIALVAPVGAGADTSAFEAYCPKTNVGDIGLPGTVVSGSLSPTPVTAGAAISVSNLAVKVTIPAGLVQAAAALGNTAIAGYVSGQLDVSGGTPASLAIGGPPTAPATQYAGTGAFSATLPPGSAATPQPLPITIPLTAGSITAGASGGTLTVSVHPTLSVFDLVNASPLTYLPLSCSGVSTTKVGALAAAMAQGASGPLAVAGGGLSQSLATGAALMIVDGSKQAFATVSAPAASGAKSVSVTTAAGSAWTAKIALASGDELDLLTPTPEQIDSASIGAASGTTTTTTTTSTTTTTTTTTPGGSTTTTPVSALVSPSSGSTGAGSAGTTGSAAGTSSRPATAATGGSLAFTGPGRGALVVGLVGLVLLDLGYLALTAVDRPRRLLARALGRTGAAQGGDGDAVTQS